MIEKWIDVLMTGYSDDPMQRHLERPYDTIAVTTEDIRNGHMGGMCLTAERLIPKFTHVILNLRNLCESVEKTREGAFGDHFQVALVIGDVVEYMHVPAKSVHVIWHDGEFVGGLDSIREPAEA